MGRATGGGGAQPVPKGATDYGGLYSAPLGDLTELRRRQAEFGRTTQDLDRQNSWMAIPVIAPALTVAGLEAAIALASRFAAPAAMDGPLALFEREPWQRNSRAPGQPLDLRAKSALWRQGREKFAQANGISARDLQAQVHHSDPLEWAHLKPGADPNRLANLWALPKDAHNIATQEWANFSKSVRARVPTQAELMAAKLRIDRMVEPYIRRAGTPRSIKKPGDGGLY